MTTNHEKLTFKPRPSTGWMWVGSLGLLLLVIGLNLLIKSGLSGPHLVTILLTVPLGAMFLLVTAFFPAMRYEIKDEYLVLTYGPLLRYTIDINQIKSIRRRDIGFSLVSSFRFPGLALFNVPYPEIGTVKMCATSTSTGILLIDTGSTKYGLTPENEQEFVTELQNRMRR